MRLVMLTFLYRLWPFMITGIGVHDRPEPVFRINWIGCSQSNGIRLARDPPERAPCDDRGAG